MLIRAGFLMAFLPSEANTSNIGSSTKSKGFLSRNFSRIKERRDPQHTHTHKTTTHTWPRVQHPVPPANIPTTCQHIDHFYERACWGSSFRSGWNQSVHPASAALRLAISTRAWRCGAEVWAQDALTYDGTSAKSGICYFCILVVGKPAVRGVLVCSLILAKTSAVAVNCNGNLCAVSQNFSIEGSTSIPNLDCGMSSNFPVTAGKQGNFFVGE